jgi:hypothetical protein
LETQVNRSIASLIGATLSTILASGCFPHARLGNDFAEVEDGDLVLELREGTFDGTVLKGRVALHSKKKGFTLEPGAVYCAGLFQLIDAQTCEGRPIDLLIRDCVGGGRTVPEHETALPPGVWLGSDEEWPLTERREDCVEVTVQAFLDGRSRKHPGPQLKIRAKYEGSVSNIPGG